MLYRSVSIFQPNVDVSSFSLHEILKKSFYGDQRKFLSQDHKQIDQSINDLFFEKSSKLWQWLKIRYSPERKPLFRWRGIFIDFVFIPLVFYILIIAVWRVLKRRKERERKLAISIECSFIAPIFALFREYLYKDYPLAFEDFEQIINKFEEIHNAVTPKICKFEENISNKYLNKESRKKLKKEANKMIKDKEFCQSNELWMLLIDTLIEKYFYDRALSKINESNIDFAKNIKYKRCVINAIHTGYNQIQTVIRRSICDNFNENETKLIMNTFSVLHRCSIFFPRMMLSQMDSFVTKKVKKIEKRSRDLLKGTSRFECAKRIWAIIQDGDIGVVRKEVHKLKREVKNLNELISTIENKIESVKTEYPPWFSILKEAGDNYKILISEIERSWKESSDLPITKVMNEIFSLLFKSTGDIKFNE